MTTRPTFRRHRIRAPLSLAVSLLAHAAAYGAAIAAPQWLIRQLPTQSPMFAGSRQVIDIQAAWSVALPVSEPIHIEPAEQQPVEVSPTEAIVEQQRLVAVPSPPPAAERPLPEVESPSAELAAAELPLPESRDQIREVTNPKPRTSAAVTRRPSAMPPTSSSSAAALPQQVGLDPTLPPSFAGNRPPNYPLLAQQRRWEGTVLLRLLISAEGEVTDVRVERSSGYEVLDAEAVAAVRGWRGSPAHRGGQPLATEELLPVRFRLQ